MIRSATGADLPALRRLWQENRHNFFTCGWEDLTDLLQTGTALVGVWPGEEAELWGFVVFDAPAPTAAPGSLADGALRAAVFDHNLPATASGNHLIAQAIAGLQATGHPFQLTALTREAWLVRLLREARFAVVDHLCLYQRTRHSLPTPADCALLRPLRQDELTTLGALDRLTFPPLWRMAKAELLELIFTCRVQAAEVDGTLAGYAAISLHPAQDRYDEAQAQLTRLAVHPSFQGRGIGRQLLIDSIAYAHAHGCYRIFLNTPESNPPAQHLYESLHFRRHGGRMPVLVFE
ncbi:MAG: GNAT family N-acetyltransferase [Caldilineaceae bacterium]